MSNELARADGRRIRRDELPFDEALLRKRIASVQREVVARGLEAVLLFDPENIFWLTGYQTLGYFSFQAMLVPREGLPTLVTRTENAELADALPTIGEVFRIEASDDPVVVLCGHIPFSGRVGLETSSRYLSVQNYRKMMRTVPLDFEDFDGVIEARRRAKVPAEIDRMRLAAGTVEAGMRAALATVRAGATDNDVAAALYQGSIAAGSEFVSMPPMVLSGRRTGYCYAPWRRKVIERGDVVVIEGAGCVDRYHAMMARTAVVGPPTDEQAEAAEALIALLETAVAAIRPGITTGEVDLICRETMDMYDVEPLLDSRTGYGIGIGFPPNWAEGHIYSIRPQESTTLRENMTFHLVPTVFREDFGMVIGDSVRVTSNGCEVLTHFPRGLAVID